MMNKDNAIIDDGTYWIEFNPNEGINNGFLMKNGKCVGGFDEQKFTARGGFRVDIHQPWDGETDVIVVGFTATVAQAVALLWDSRHDAYEG